MWRLLWDNTLSSEMAALKKKDADEIDDTCDKSLRVYWRLFEKIFVFATEFCRSNMSKKIESDRICATCCGDKNSVADAKIFTKILKYT